MTAPLCFILMPFGVKSGSDGVVVDFDAVYRDLIGPAVLDAKLEPLRADQETNSGIIHKPMFERLILCPFAVADLTMANANVFYELGVRHAFRPSSTIQLMSEGTRLPFDIQMLRTIPYKLTPGGVPDPDKLLAARQSITAFLNEARKGAKDSPIFQLLDGVREPILEHMKTDVFRDQVEYSIKWKDILASARKQGAEAVRAVERQLGNISDVESGVVIDLYLSYRATSAWAEMVALEKKMSPPLAQSVMVREQLGFALNRLKGREEAEAVLRKLIDERGPSSETLGILGRVYKDCWEDEARLGSALAAEGFLEKAIDTYLAGFESDWRDAFPGVNAITLMELRDPPDERRTQLIPVVRYAVERKIARGKPDYWDYATLVELAVLALDQKEASRNLARALACIRESWEPETTVRNLRLIREAREKRGIVPAWVKEVEDLLAKKSIQRPQASA
jgi:tetratricopeptide (TPR) repeat protein